MGNALSRYQRAGDPLPERMPAWTLTGAGWDSLGQGDRPAQMPLPAMGPEELLARIDACSLCFSDLKVLRAGGTHPRLVGRDLQQEPVILGHEVALTIVGVGGRLRDQYRIGGRFTLQPDVYYGGRGLAYGYMLQGGLAGYGAIGKEILRGDEGCYLLPLRPDDGYAETALAEPWACIEASCRLRYRDRPKAGGRLWVIGNDGSLDEAGWRWLAQAGPAVALCSDLSSAHVEQGRAILGEAGIPLSEVAVAEVAAGSCDDILILGAARPEAIERGQRAGRREAIICILAKTPLTRPAQVDVGLIHYERHLFVGAADGSLETAYRPPRSEFLAGGRALVVGAAGAMGQMWTQRALEMAEGPAQVLAVNLSSGRADALWARAAEGARASFAALRRGDMALEAYHAAARARLGGPADDIILLAPAAGAVSEALPLLAPHGSLNIFAGLPRGSLAALDLSGVYLRGQRLIGGSGSSLADLRYTLDKVQRGELQTRHSVAAVGGIEAGKAGLLALAERVFPGKIIIYPHLRGLPLTPLSELGRVAPAACVRLEGGAVWTRAAEMALLEQFLYR
jgi:threonine dehydrogenase-like Zn-dependent dehydrogenase